MPQIKFNNTAWKHLKSISPIPYLQDPDIVMTTVMWFIVLIFLLTIEKAKHSLQILFNIKKISYKNKDMSYWRELMSRLVLQ